MPNLTMEVLEAQIKLSKAQLATQKMLLTDLKRQERGSLVQTKVIKLLGQGLRALAKPGLMLHQFSNELVENPSSLLKAQAVRSSFKALWLSKLCKERTDKKAKRACLKLVNAAMKLDQFLEKYPDQKDDNLTALVQKLDVEIQRLRPPADEKSRQDLKESVAEVFQYLSASVQEGESHAS